MRHCYRKTSLRLKVRLQLQKIRLSGACRFQSLPDQPCSTGYSIAYSPGALITCHISIQINHQPDATIFQFIILTFIYSSTCFGRFPAHYQELNDYGGSLWFYLRIVVTVVLRSWSGRPARPRTQHGFHHDTKAKPEAVTVVIELLMMGGKTPEACWAVNKRQNNKLENCCIWLVIYLNCTAIHGFTNLKFYI
jgi:hypothetical protein